MSVKPRVYEEFRDTKGESKTYKSKDRQHSGQKDKQNITKNLRSSNTNPTKTGGESR